MPTAVERLFDSFLKFDGIDSRHEQVALNNAFLKIDSDFLKLSSANPDTFLKLEHDHSLKVDFDVIGDAFVKLASDFNKIASAGTIIDDVVLKLAGNPTTSSVDGAPNPQADFVVLDHKLSNSATDLKILGADFLKIDGPPNLKVFESKVAGIGNDFLKLGADMAADRDAFLKLGADFLKLDNGENQSPLDLFYKELGGELKTVGMRFDALATDFLKLGQEVQATGGAGSGDVLKTSTVGTDAGPGVIGASFMTLFQDFHLLGTALDKLGDGAGGVISDLSHKTFMGDGGHG
jgi:hypothetical protein